MDDNEYFNFILKLIEEKIKDYYKKNNDYTEVFKFDYSKKYAKEFYSNQFNHNSFIEFLNNILYEDEEFVKKYLSNSEQFYIENNIDRILSSIDNPIKNKLVVSTLIFKISPEKKYVDENILEIKNQNGFEGYYRGQSDYRWNLTPSYFRGLKNDKYVDVNELYNTYYNEGLLTKWKNIFRKDEKITIEFLSFMQHAISFSPFIDFTKDIDIALAFALKNRMSLNEFYNNDSSVFSLKINEKNPEKINDKNDLILDDFYINYISKYNIGSDINHKKVECFSDIIDELTPKYYFITNQNSDRMKRQNGQLLFFYNFTCVGGYIFPNLNHDLRIKKYIIKKENKKELYKNIQEDNSLALESLLDPYLCFKK